VALHDKLYSAELRPFLRSDLAYEPHITLAHFAQPSTEFELDKPQDSRLDNARYNQAQARLQTLDLDFECRIARLDLVQVNADVTRVENLSTFALSA
jgi:hypothetical protein